MILMSILATIVPVLTHVTDGTLDSAAPSVTIMGLLIVVIAILWIFRQLRLNRYVVRFEKTVSVSAVSPEDAVSIARDIMQVREPRVYVNGKLFS